MEIEVFAGLEKKQVLEKGGSGVRVLWPASEALLQRRAVAPSRLEAATQAEATAGRRRQATHALN